MKRYQFIAVDSVQIPKIHSIGFSDDPRVTHFGPSVRNQYIIHYVLSGKGVFNGKEVRQGQGFLIVPGMHEEYHSCADDPWSFLWIISEDSNMEHFFRCHNADDKSNIFQFHNCHELYSISHELCSAQSTISSSTRLSELFLRIFHACVVKEPVVKTTMPEVYFEYSVNYIKSNLHLPITVSDLCNAIGITQPYLYRIFTQRTNFSPKQYIINCKLDEAKRLLLQTEFSISQIAATVGFDNVLDFSKVFSRVMKVSPTAFRKCNSKNHFKVTK